MTMIQDWLAALRKRMFKRAFWVEVLVALVVGGGIFWGVNKLRTNGYIVTQELQHHDFLHLLQEPDFGTKLITHTNVVIIGADEWDIQRFGWPLQDDTVAQILGKIASFKPAAIALDLYRDMPVPKRGDLIHHLNEVLTNNANIITISQVDLEEPELTIKPPAVLQGDAVRVGENSFASDPDLKIRRGMLYFYSDAGIHPSLAIQMAARYIGKNWWELLAPAPGPVLKIPSLPFQSLGLTNGQQIAMAVVQKTSRGQAVEIDNTEVIKLVASDNPLQYSEGGEVIPSTNIIELLDARDVGDLNGDISSVTVTTADGVLAVDTRVRGVALPPSDWYPEAIGAEYEFSILLDTDNDPSTGFQPDGI
ncbi:MAG: CHASE2 domain-containing protein, partial [Verrucomicrobiota bacterium]